MSYSIKLLTFQSVSDYINNQYFIKYYYLATAGILLQARPDHIILLIQYTVYVDCCV